jgi:hypothetical protein
LQLPPGAKPSANRFVLCGDKAGNFENPRADRGERDLVYFSVWLLAKESLDYWIGAQTTDIA